MHFLSYFTDCVNVNQVYDNPGYYSCECVPASDGCISSGSCVKTTDCPSKNGQKIGNFEQQ